MWVQRVYYGNIRQGTIPQAVERCVRLVCTASSYVCGFEQRDGYVKATILSKQMLKFFDSKKDFTD